MADKVVIVITSVLPERRERLILIIVKADLVSGQPGNDNEESLEGFAFIPAPEFFLAPSRAGLKSAPSPFIDSQLDGQLYDRGLQPILIPELQSIEQLGDAIQRYLKNEAEMDAAVEWGEFTTEKMIDDVENLPPGEYE